jgi:hypothetical protein
MITIYYGLLALLALITIGTVGTLVYAIAWTLVAARRSHLDDPSLEWKDDYAHDPEALRAWKERRLP